MPGAPASIPASEKEGKERKQKDSCSLKLLKMLHVFALSEVTGLSPMSFSLVHIPVMFSVPGGGMLHLWLQKTMKAPC